MELWLWIGGAVVALLAVLIALRKPLSRSLAIWGYASSPENTWRRLLMELSSDPMVLVHRSGSIAEANQNACELAGYTQAELLGKRIESLVAQQDQPAVLEALGGMPHARTLTGHLLLENKKHEMIRTEWRWVPAARDQFYVIVRDLRAPTQFDAPAAPAEELAVLNRVSLAVSQLVELDSVLNHAIEESMKVVRCDVGAITFINKDANQISLAAQHGLPADRLRQAIESTPLSGHPLTQRLLETREIIYYKSLNRAPLAPPVLEVMQEEEVQSLIAIPIVSKGRVLGQLDLGVRRPNTFTNVNTAVLGAIGEQVGMAIENVRLLEQVSEKAIHLQHVLNSSPAAILVVSYLPQGDTVTLANSRFGELFGITPDTVVLRRFDEMKPSWQMCFENSADCTERFQRVMSQRRIEERGEINLQRPKKRVLDHYTAPVFDDFQQVVGRIWVFTDITEQKALAESLRQSQKLESIGTLAAGIAHDFKNLLGAVMGNLTLVRDNLGQNAGADQPLASIESAVANGVEMCQGLLAFGRKAGAQLVPMDLGEVVQRAARLLKSSLPANVQLLTDAAADAQPVEADGTQMLQVIMNLAINARDAMPKGGRIILHVTTREVDQRACSQSAEARAGRFTVLAVEDTGDGIPPELLQRIFEPFFTTKPAGKGTGLGLAMVYGIAKSHKGWVQVQSQVGVGTTFEVFLPVTDKPLPASAPPIKTPHVPVAQPVPTPAPASGATILVADDDPMLLDLTKTFLERGGYHVLTAISGDAAVELFRANAASVKLAILDMTMPGMGGVDCLREMKKLQPALKAFFLTGHTADLVGEEAAKAGAIGVLTKPLQRAVLLEEVRKALAA